MASCRRVGGRAGLSRGAGGVRLRRVPLEPRSRARSAGPSRQAFARKRRSASLRSSDDPGSRAALGGRVAEGARAGAEVAGFVRGPFHACPAREAGRVQGHDLVGRLDRRSRRRELPASDRVHRRNVVRRRAQERQVRSAFSSRSRFNSAASRAIKFPLSSRPTSRPKGARKRIRFAARPLTLQFSGVPRDQISVIVSPDQ